MKTILGVLLLAAFSAPCFAAIYNVGDKPPNVCWQDDADARVCSDDFARVRVFLFNTGWCPPCNTEFSHLVNSLAEFEGKAVTFISLSAEGWSRGSSPTKAFLEQWKTRHSLAACKAHLIVAASPRNAGHDYFVSPSIPNVVILNVNGEVAYKAIAPSLSTVAAEVRKLLPKVVPVPTN